MSSTFFVQDTGSQELYRYRVLLFIETTNHYGRTIVEGINHFALEHNWLVSFEQRGRFDPVFPRKNIHEFDGIISRTYFRKTLNMLAGLHLPYVELVFQNSADSADVSIDEEALSQLVFNHFHDRLLRNFAWYQMEQTLFDERRNSFVNLVNAHGYVCHECPIPPANNSNYFMPRWSEKHRPIIRKWLLSLPKPIGIYAGIDQHAQHILELCNELELRVPQDIAVVGVENDEWFCRMLYPPLSSADTAGHTVGYKAAELLEAKMNGTYRAQPPLLVPPSFLAIRESSDFYAVEDSDILDALNFIRENACNGIDLKDVMEAVNLSRSSLYRGFDRYLHRTPQSEIFRVQMETARTLLRETNLLVSSIGLRVGFTTPEYFVRAFRRENGITPNEYRKKMLYGKGNDIGE